ncbi:MAG: Holliday junction branch migration protein RuvA [Elusimicrobiota bacterium]
MIDYINGRLKEKRTDKVVVEAGGLGYSVLIPSSTFSVLPIVGESVKLYIYESAAMYGSAVSWYGFITQEDRELFDMIKGVSKIGAKGALDILSKAHHSLPQFKDAILNKDSKILTSYFGFTKITAEKLVLGLKDKIKKLTIVNTQHGGQDSGRPNNYISLEYSGNVNDAINGLIALGYKEQIARSIIQEVLDIKKGEELSVEELITASLRYLAKSKF